MSTSRQGESKRGKDSFSLRSILFFQTSPLLLFGSYARRLEAPRIYLQAGAGRKPPFT